MRIDAVTKRWIRNASDEKAAANGCKFDEERGQWVVDWMATYLRLYEGEQAGEPFESRDWQYDCTMRLFGWVRESPKWKRSVRRFKRASIWKPKKQKKSPQLAAWGLYLLCADGEQGQKVFCCGKDAMQVRENVALHVLEMVLASDELLAECHINRNLMKITHEPSRSVLMPLSSNDVNAQKAKEGINGCVLVDETHVVDRGFMNRVERAGISRSEPLHIEVSSAGNEPQSYGYQQYEYGKRVESGEHEDQSFLFDCHEAPQDLSDEDLHADPVKWGKIANPSWGHTIDEEEFLDDYNRSRVSLATFADFKMYRLDIWQTASNPAIRKEDWAACFEQFDLSELDGCECYGAIDLGFTRDSTSLQLWFPWDGDDDQQHYRLLSWFWIPEEVTRREAKNVDWLAWGQRGDVKITTGNTADFPLIRNEIVALSERYSILQLNYDPRFAEVLALQLQDEHGIHVCSFQQSAQKLNEPSRSFEKLILDRRVRHPGNLVMGWQVGNLTWREYGQLRLPSKPKRNPLARIDGPAAAIMGLAAAEIPDSDDDAGWYEKGEMTGQTNARREHEAST